MTSPMPTPLSDEDYGAIEAAVIATARGRSFLREFARRQRHADTLSLLDAIARLEQRLAAGRVERDAAAVEDIARAAAAAAADLLDAVEQIQDAAWTLRDQANAWRDRPDIAPLAAGPRALALIETLRRST